MRWMLLVDTCGGAGGVATAGLSPGNGDPALPRLIAERVLPGRETQELLMAAVDDVLRQTSLRPADLDVIAVVTGPGSFTGVRIGLAAVKGLAEALEKPVVAVSRLAVLAAQAGSAGEVEAWIDAGRSDVFVGRYQAAERISEAMMHGADALASERVPVVVMEERLALLCPRAQRVPEVGLREAFPLAAQAAAAGQFADLALLDANYLRVPDAELARLAKLAVAVQGIRQMSVPEVQIRPATAADLAQISRIAGESPSAPQWTPAQYAEVLERAGEGAALRRTLLVAASEGQVAGYAIVSALCAVYPVEAELEALAVSPASRRRGLGSALLQAVAAWSQAQGADVLRLEVRAGNAGALCFYAAHGFAQASTRRGYYAHPVEDAVCMERPVGTARLPGAGKTLPIPEPGWPNR